MILGHVQVVDGRLSWKWTGVRYRESLRRCYLIQTKPLQRTLFISHFSILPQFVHNRQIQYWNKKQKTNKKKKNKDSKITSALDRWKLEANLGR